MGSFKEKHAIRIDNQPINGKNENEDETKQKSQAIQRKDGPRQAPGAPSFGAAARGAVVKLVALLKLLNKSNQRKSGYNDRQQTEEQRIRDDEVNSEGVGLAHAL